MQITRQEGVIDKPVEMALKDAATLTGDLEWCRLLPNAFVLK